MCELYLTDHPRDGFTSPVAANNEFPEMAGLIGVRDIRYGKGGVMMVIGANPTDGHPVLASRMKKRLRQGQSPSSPRTASTTCACRISRQAITRHCGTAPTSQC